MGNGVSSRSAESPIPMGRDVSATGGNTSSEDEVPTSFSRGMKQTNENLPCESERPPVRYNSSRQIYRLLLYFTDYKMCTNNYIETNLCFLQKKMKKARTYACISVSFLVLFVVFNFTIVRGK